MLHPNSSDDKNSLHNQLITPGTESIFSPNKVYLLSFLVTKLEFQWNSRFSTHLSSKYTYQYKDAFFVLCPLCSQTVSMIEAAQRQGLHCGWGWRPPRRLSLEVYVSFGFYFSQTKLIFCFMDPVGLYWMPHKTMLLSCDHSIESVWLVSYGQNVDVFFCMTLCSSWMRVQNCSC